MAISGFLKGKKPLNSLILLNNYKKGCSVLYLQMFLPKSDESNNRNKKSTKGALLIA